MEQQQWRTGRLQSKDGMLSLSLSLSLSLCLSRQLRDKVSDTSLQSVAPPGFCNRGEVRYGSIGGLEYEDPQSGLYCLCVNVALCSTALQCICRVIRRSSMTMKARIYYIIFGRPPIGGKLPPPLPLAASLVVVEDTLVTRVIVPLLLA